ncbi:MAG TPA: hypothetical protein HA252_01590 [Candidatus Diapherotrites archaeon]|uniref:Lipoprotein n=1 Tax=Candidatus Iainarchaeum sp. TaxID=3101447 RepID=A0A7J4JJF4_9ARCH|nr:hypothetical protein [Candidatus Diapherotrites archaeon]HIH16077.1 hypothetical protein [Candidatus Diapherotrites archaeon]
MRVTGFLVVSLLVLASLAGCVQLQQDAPKPPVGGKPVPASPQAQPPQAPQQVQGPGPSPVPSGDVQQRVPLGPMNENSPYILSDNPLGEGFGLPAAGLATGYRKSCSADRDCASLNTSCQLFACQDAYCEPSVNAC